MVKLISEIFQLAVKPWRRPLTMGNQCSEMKAKYTGLCGINMNTVYNARVQPFNLSDHHLEGNSKVKYRSANQYLEL